MAAMSSILEVCPPFMPCNLVRSCNDKGMANLMPCSIAQLGTVPLTALHHVDCFPGSLPQTCFVVHHCIVARQLPALYTISSALPCTLSFIKLSASQVAAEWATVLAGTTSRTAMLEWSECYMSRNP